MTKGKIMENINDIDDDICEQTEVLIENIIREERLCIH